MVCNHLIIVASIDTPSRTTKESGIDKNDGRGYPLEKSRMSSRTLSNSLGDKERRLRDVLVGFAFVIDVVDVRAVVADEAFLLFVSSTVSLSCIICLFKKSMYRPPSQPTPASAKNIAVQSESRTRSAFRPRQYCATLSLSFSECTSIMR